MLVQRSVFPDPGAKGRAVSCNSEEALLYGRVHLLLFNKQQKYLVLLASSETYLVCYLLVNGQHAMQHHTLKPICYLPRVSRRQCAAAARPS